MVTGVLVVQVHQQVGGPPEVGVTLGRQRAGPGILDLEVGTDADQRLWRG